MSRPTTSKAKWAGESARAYNRTNVMKQVLDTPGIDRTTLSKTTGLTNAAMTRIVQELIEAKLLKDVGQLQSDGRGRRRSGLAIDENGGYVLGISILAFNSSIVLSSITGEIIDSLPLEPTEMSNVQQTLDEIAQMALLLLDKHQLDKQRVLGVGVAVAGYLNESGDVLDSSYYLGWPPFNLQRSLAQRLNVNVVVDNVNRCIAVAESRLGSCVGVQEMVLIRAALGLGAAIITHGNILRGHANQAGQVGHTPINQDGIHCFCGAQGCLNTVASGWAILNQLGLSDKPSAGPGALKTQKDKLKHVLEQALAGEQKFQQVISKSGKLLATHNLSLLHSLAPEIIVLTGPLGGNTVYCDAFQTALLKGGITAKVITDCDQKITAPASAASALALETYVYSPAFDIQPLLPSFQLDNVQAEALVL
jgi:predicted NBD/HSP70 family sugar kinase